MVIRAVVWRVVRFEAIAEAALILSAVFTNMPWVVAFVTNDARGVGREVGSRNESRAYCGELTVPLWTVNGRGRSRTDGDFDPRGGFG